MSTYPEEFKRLEEERDEYHNQYHLCEAKLLSHQSIIRQLQSENNRLKYLIKKFEKWCSDSCPYTEAKDNFCPCREPKKEHIVCKHDGSEGWCYARYYEKMFDELKGGE